MPGVTDLGGGGYSGQPVVQAACMSWLWPWLVTSDVVGGTVASISELVSVVVMIGFFPQTIFIPQMDDLDAAYCCGGSLSTVVLSPNGPIVSQQSNDRKHFYRQRVTCAEGHTHRRERQCECTCR